MNTNAKKLLLWVTIFTALCFWTIKASAYHEFKVPKKAYKKVTIDHFSNDKQKTEPDSTVTIFYDKDGVEIHREFKKGCSNIINLWEVDSLLNSIQWNGASDTLSMHRGTIIEDAIWTICDPISDTLTGEWNQISGKAGRTTKFILPINRNSLWDDQ